jgi:hypothetical protein
MNGQGIIKYTNGTTYEGQFIDGKILEKLSYKNDFDSDEKSYLDDTRDSKMSAKSAYKDVFDADEKSNSYDFSDDKMSTITMSPISMSQYDSDSKSYSDNTFDSKMSAKSTYKNDY